MTMQKTEAAVTANSQRGRPVSEDADPRRYGNLIQIGTAIQTAAATQNRVTNDEEIQAVLNVIGCQR